MPFYRSRMTAMSPSQAVIGGDAETRVAGSRPKPILYQPCHDLPPTTIDRSDCTLCLIASLYYIGWLAEGVLILLACLLARTLARSVGRLDGSHEDRKEQAERERPRGRERVKLEAFTHTDPRPTQHTRTF